MESTVSVKKEVPDADLSAKAEPIDITDSSNSSDNSWDASDLNSTAKEIYNHCKIPKRKQTYKVGEASFRTKKPKLEQPHPLGPPSHLALVLDVEPISEQFPQNFENNFGNGDHGSIINRLAQVTPSCKQFWKAGDYEGVNDVNDSNSALCSVGLDHVRIHPKFLHSNATSHKWSLGAFAELLDNSLDEVCNGATFVHIDVLINEKDGSKMLLVDDNGGGMNPDKMRQCMSLGYSVKSKLANTIGQYGNGFKTSTMRLGADVIVFSRCRESDGRSSTQSIGMLSYTFLRATGKEDIVVPMVDYEKSDQGWRNLMRASLDDWNRNLETIMQWSPYSSEQKLLQQLDVLGEHGTRIIIYNLWEDDEGLLELDFDADPHDIQLRGVNRDEKSISMANKYPNSRHYFTYRHSLRSYASILYLRLPSYFRIILRDEDVEHHDIVNDMMLESVLPYKPKISGSNNSDVTTNVTLGFVKDAKAHIDIQGFNVYHKNRLIKPFWRVWNAAGSDGRGVIGVLEANFVEPAHDKQGFERTTLLSRLEARLLWMQKNYWSSTCQKVGYAPRRSVGADKEALASTKKKSTVTEQNGHGSAKERSTDTDQNDHGSASGGSTKSSTKQDRSCDKMSHSRVQPQRQAKLASSIGAGPGSADRHAEKIVKLEERKRDSRERLRETSRPTMDSLVNELKLERDRCKSLEKKLQNALQKLEKAEEEIQETKKKVVEAEDEHLALVDIVVDERKERDMEEERLRNQLTDASKTIEDLLEKVKQLEGGRRELRSRKAVHLSTNKATKKEV
ncbi:hypothetical protein FNV43_RR27091 [Rhamnella rubrinervis]|uniref:Morc S5 domain-containing protein n=1 Tax=Rhamnella rubrinervis TaxID=2594499 RepID=A0A8K0DL01_9ROSA|nr:hypothetical protein FNV43_RR27091 [Rhamnella rubrinervis]